MPTDLMLSVAAENLQAKLKQTAEEQRRVSLIQPFHIWISGALSPVCHVLIPKLLSAEVFPGVSLISLHLLDLDGTEEGLQDLRMETQDLALISPQVTVHTNVEQAFRHADVVLLLDDGPADGESDPEEDRRTSVKKISERYREYGRLIDSRARREVKVMVSGDSFVNLRCSLLVDSACSIESRQFIAMATQLENEAKAIIAKQLNVRASGIYVTDVIVWGNISGIFYIDVQMAKVFNYDGAVKGPPFFWQPVLKWLETDLQSLAGRRRGAVTLKTGRAAGMAAANGLLAVLRAWSGAGDTQEVLSVGVPCTGRDVTADSCGPSVGDKLKERIQLSLDELLQVTQTQTPRREKSREIILYLQQTRT
uniref:Malate dehydrogenase 1B, NAD (soluble) n=1 Tax=Salarias fasciatus TaxID=181472 RepID=A0A672GNI9_SALFA